VGCLPLGKPGRYSVPPEPNILEPPADVVAEIETLQAAVGQVVSTRHDRNLLIGTWNLRAFGDLHKDWDSPEGATPRRNFRDVHAIATIVSCFDVVAVQEVRGNIRALRYLLKVLGKDWGFLLTDVTKGSAGNNERLAFLFDSRRVKPSGLACELVVWIADSPRISEDMLDRQFARTPYACSFVTKGEPATTFILVTLHVDWGKTAKDRIPELKEIARWLADWAEQEDEWKHNLIALGDFNIEGMDDDLYKAFTSTGLQPPPGLANAPRTIFDSPKKRHFYDQIAWFTTGMKDRAVLRLTCSAANYFDFVPVLKGNETLTNLSWHISDHFPLFVELELPQQ
jgi:endonuclease/exonuclease/phosphatase family metal-dependent hydrolase